MTFPMASALNVFATLMTHPFNLISIVNLRFDKVKMAATVKIAVIATTKSAMAIPN